MRRSNKRKRERPVHFPRMYVQFATIPQELQVPNDERHRHHETNRTSELRGRSNCLFRSHFLKSMTKALFRKTRFYIHLQFEFDLYS